MSVWIPEKQIPRSNRHLRDALGELAMKDNGRGNRAEMKRTYRLDNTCKTSVKGERERRI